MSLYVGNAFSSYFCIHIIKQLAPARIQKDMLISPNNLFGRDVCYEVKSELYEVEKNFRLIYLYFCLHKTNYIYFVEKNFCKSKE